MSLSEEAENWINKHLVELCDTCENRGSKYFNEQHQRYFYMCDVNGSGISQIAGNGVTYECNCYESK